MDVVTALAELSVVSSREPVSGASDPTASKQLAMCLDRDLRLRNHLSALRYKALKCPAVAVGILTFQNS